MDWKPGISIEACRQLQVRYGPDFNKALDHWRKEVRRTQKVVINGVTFFFFMASGHFNFPESGNLLSSSRTRAIVPFTGGSICIDSRSEPALDQIGGRE